MKGLFVILAIFFAVSAFAGTCGGNCPGGNCPTCPCGSSKNYVDGASICNKYSGWSQTCCKCIASHESGNNANAVGYNTNGSFDVGLY